MLAAAGQRWEFAAIGTSWQIRTDEPLSERVRASVAALIERFDREWSRFRPDSAITALAEGVDGVALPADARAMFELYDALDTATDGRINPLIGDVLARRGYDAAYGFVDAGPAAAPARWRELISCEGQMLRLSIPALIDVGALGKGRLVDLVLAELTREGEGHIVVDASGDLAVRSGAAVPPERVALEHPYDPRRAIGVWEVQHGALCASAVNRRAWGDGLHHVLDARTGQPVQAIAATWAVAETAMVADAVATGLFFDGGAQFAHEQEAAWVRMYTDGRVEWSPECRAELFT